jgi:16S rRNA (cytosine1402-N4)-methyltransferase
MLSPKPGESVLDVTLGLGGHAEAWLTATSPNGSLIAIDADAENIATAKKRLSAFGDRLIVHHRNFKTLRELLPFSVDIVFADLGLSSPHVDDTTRGFTFRASAPLDLRYDRSRGDTAAHFLATAELEQILSVLRTYGEVDRAKLLAQKLQETFRVKGADGKTDDVRACVDDVFGYKAPSVLPQVFQALRIAVNDELGAVEALLASLPEIVKVGGRVGIISYHSLEDRLVKQAFRYLASVKKDSITGQDAEKPRWEIVTKKAVVPSEAETKRNPRSRSAKFRVLRRLAE